MKSTIKFPGRRRLLAAAALALSAPALWWLIRARAPAPPADAPATLTIQAEPLTQDLALVGRIEAADQETIGAPFDGEVTRKLAREGQRVERGEILLELDTAELDIRLRDALAERLKAGRALDNLRNWRHGPEVARARRGLAAARQGLDEAERRLAESRVLLEQGIIAKMEVDGLAQQRQVERLALAAAEEELRAVLERDADASLQIARMELANADARHAALRALRERKEVRAPFAGVLLRPAGGADGTQAEPVRGGAHVARGQPLFALASLDRVKVTAKVDETDVRQFHAGQAVAISGDAFAGAPLAGVVAGVGAQALPGTPDGGGARFEVSVAVAALSADQLQKVRLGMSANLAVRIYDNPRAVVLPVAALHTENGKSFVRLAGAPARTREVKPGRATETGVEVTGLAPGTVILAQ